MGETVNDFSVIGFTLRVADPLTLPEVAVIVAVPIAIPVARPDTETVAEDVVEDDQLTDVVMSLVEPSEYVPDAANCCVAPTYKEGFAGETEIVLRITDGVAVESPLPPPHPKTNDTMNAKYARNGSERVALDSTAPAITALVHFMALSFDRETFVRNRHTC